MDKAQLIIQHVDRIEAETTRALRRRFNRARNAARGDADGKGEAELAGIEQLGERLIAAGNEGLPPEKHIRLPERPEQLVTKSTRPTNRPTPAPTPANAGG